MIKKLFVSFILLFLLSNTVWATPEYVSALENRLFGTVYSHENYKQRVDRIEQEIYGKNYIGNSEERLEKIYKIYPPEEILNTRTSFDNKRSNDDNFVHEENEYTDYPIIALFEEQTLLKTYKNENIYKRLDRLEQKIYGETQNNLSLNERVENLKKHIKITNNKNINSEKSEYYYDNDYDNNYYNNYNTTNDRISNILKEMEYESFSHSFPNDSAETRLNRLEKYYFGAYQNNMSEKQRLTKLAKIITKKHNDDYNTNFNGITRMERNAQWAELIMNLLIIGLGFIL